MINTEMEISDIHSRIYNAVVALVGGHRSSITTGELINFYSRVTADKISNAAINMNLHDINTELEMLYINENSIDAMRKGGAL